MSTMQPSRTGQYTPFLAALADMADRVPDPQLSTFGRLLKAYKPHAETISRLLYERLPAADQRRFIQWFLKKWADIDTVNPVEMKLYLQAVEAVRQQPRDPVEIGGRRYGVMDLKPQGHDFKLVAYDIPRGNIAGAAWSEFGAVIKLRSLDEAPALADRIAAEHVEIATADPDALSVRIRNAGAIFLGRHTPEVIGDYVAGSNHVLPTARSARFASGLGVLDFMKRTSILRLDPKSLAALAPAAMTLARAEGLEAHRRSVEIRETNKPS